MPGCRPRFGRGDLLRPLAGPPCDHVLIDDLSVGQLSPVGSLRTVQSDPRVTVGLAVYNGEQFLAAALTSLVDQDFEDLEIIVADNGSTDGTIAIVRTSWHAIPA